MDPRERFCHNERCWAYGRAGEGHIVIHSQKERRYKCKRCHKTFSETRGTALYRAHKSHELVVAVVTLLAYGCPVQAIVAAFSLDERTIARWQKESGHQPMPTPPRAPRPGRRGAPGARPGRRVAHSDRWGRFVVGLGAFGWQPTLAWRGGPGTTRSRLDSLAPPASARLRRFRCPLALHRWPLQLPQASSEGVSRAASHRETRASEAPFAGESDGRPGDQTLLSATGDRCGSSRRARHGGGGTSSAECHAGRRRQQRGDQHLLHRAASGHLSLPARPTGAQNSLGDSPKGDARSRDVVDRHVLQLVPCASFPEIGKKKRHGGRRAAMDRTDSGTSRGAHRSSLVVSRTA
jgi:hypothetical protein